jgi:hypothetical protein
MARTHRQNEPLETNWEIDDRLWAQIEPLLWEDTPPTPKDHGRRLRIDWRAELIGIIYRMRTGCHRLSGNPLSL